MSRTGRAIGRVGQELTALLVVLGLFCGPALVSARQQRSKAPASNPALQSSPELLDPSAVEPPPAGEPGAPDYAALTRQLEAAYRQTPTPELLYKLGIFTQLLGRSIESQDLMRRYLADPLTGPGAAGWQQAERIVALPRPPSGEVQVVADEEGLLLIDGRLAGALPLALPLLVPVGKHVISLEMPDKTMKGTVEVLDGRGAEMRFNRASGAVVVTLPPAVIVLAEYVGAAAPPELMRRLEETTEKAIQRAHLASYGKAAALRRKPKLAGCLTTLTCQAQLAVQTDVDYVLALRLERRMSAPEYMLNLQLIDAAVEDVAATATFSCALCTPEQLTAQLGSTLQRLLKDGPGRPHGTLLLRSEPPGAEVRKGERVLGQTPYEHAAYVGTQELTLHRPDYAPETVRIVVQEGKKATAEVALSLVEPTPATLVPPPVSPQAPPPPPRRRPLWRLVTGGVAVGLGLLLAGYGVSGLVIDGQCVSPPEPPAINCRDRFDTLPTGAELVGAGAALSVAGVVLLALPPSGGGSTQAPLTPTPVAPVPPTVTGLGYTLSF